MDSISSLIVSSRYGSPEGMGALGVGHVQWRSGQRHSTFTPTSPQPTDERAASGAQSAPCSRD